MVEILEGEVRSWAAIAIINLLLMLDLMKSQHAIYFKSITLKRKEKNYLSE